MKKTVFLLSSIMLLFSCKKQVEHFQYIDYQDVPTINAILTNGEPVWVQIFMSKQLDSIHPSICETSSVFLYENGEFVEKLEYDSETKIYIGNTIPKERKEYQGKAIFPDGDTVKASATMPDVPEMTKIEVVEKATIDKEGNSRPAFLFTFKTSPRCELCYSLIIEADLEYCDGFQRLRCYGQVDELLETSDTVLLDSGTHHLLFNNSTINDTIYTK